MEGMNWSFRKRLPVILQTEQAECGLACLAMIAGYYGYCCGVAEMRYQYDVSLAGMRLDNLMKVAKKYNLGTRPVRLRLEDLGKLTLPCVLHWEFNHYVVLKSVTLYHVIIHDPASGVKRLSMSDVNASFTGVALELRPDEGFKPRQARSRLKLRQLCGNIGGLSRSVTQVVVLSLAIEVLSLVSPFFLQWTLDHVLLTNDKGLLITLAIGFGVLLVTQQAITAAREWVMLYVSTMINVQWKGNVFKHLVALPVEFFEKRQLGDVISRFGEVDEIQGALTGTFFSAVLDGLMALITGVLMAVYSPKLFGIAVLAMLGYVVTRCIFYYPLRNSLSEQVVHAAHQQTHFLETIRAVRTIKLFQREQERCSTWTALLVRQINAGLKTHKIQLLYSHINGLIFGVENLVAVSIGALIVMETNLTIGTLMAFLAYKSQFLGRVMNLIDQIFTMSLLRIHTERLGDVVLHPPETTETPLALGLVNDAAATIKVKGLKYRYSADDPFIINGVELVISAGESVAITGPSGCGKSTLVDLLLGAKFPTQGEISIAGIKVRPCEVSAIRNVIGAVLQDDSLFIGSLFENISFFDSHPDKEWIVECARSAAIHEEILSLPMGYHTLVGDMGVLLSGGQKQRILIARALYKRPKILILDEATSHLDATCERMVNKAIRDLAITRIIIAHRCETIASADRVILLEAGKILEEKQESLSPESTEGSL